MHLRVVQQSDKSTPLFRFSDLSSVDQMLALIRKSEQSIEIIGLSVDLVRSSPCVIAGQIGSLGLSRPRKKDKAAQTQL